ncbi:DUF1877 family protein [Nocardia sp. NPDC050406]|uniref:DUF1877 family protein n=1 Tax=Nocardia sp. NPDC050406 TaxID=3364318 RepID=UPI00379A29DD
MGVTISFVLVTDEELTRATELSEQAWEAYESGDVDDTDELDEPVYEIYYAADHEAEPDGSLGKSWAGLQFLFDAHEGIEIDLRLDGDGLTVDSHLMAWSPYYLQKAAEQLRAVPFDELARHFDPDRMNAEQIYPGGGWSAAELDYLRRNYDSWRRFLDHAVDSGMAAIRYFG